MTKEEFYAHMAPENQFPPPLPLGPCNDDPVEDIFQLEEMIERFLRTDDRRTLKREFRYYLAMRK